ncbi:unnamed protein product [Somion occarium]|uniref:SNF2 family DNA-dependent ATPase n=1 Tax=Somion occarium TaxID=3059160 RepID=A0ABP1CKE9_9APHY
MQSAQQLAPPPPNLHNQSNPIDLTLDEDEDDSYVNERACKRTCPLGRSFNAINTACPDAAPNQYSPPYHSGLSPAMSSSSLQAEGRVPPGSSYNYADTQSPTNSLQQPLQPPIQPPNVSIPLLKSPFPSFPGFPVPPLSVSSSRPVAPASYYETSAPTQSQPYATSSTPGPSSNAQARQVIDLTNSPSPPPYPQQPIQGTSIADLSPSTPVCIGQLTATALVLYPIPYLCQQPAGVPDPEWARVRLAFENRNGGQPTIHIKAPTTVLPNGQQVPGENFAVVEQKVASSLGGLMSKGHIRLDAKVRRDRPNLPILPLQMLVFTPKANIPAVSSFFQQNGLLLDHPTLPSDIQRLSAPDQYYFNPHNPPPGGFARASAGLGRPGYTGVGAGTMGRWNPQVAGKSVEIQRSQVEELFKSLKDGDELEETEPPPEVATPLYPHQKKALTFLLERERERPGPDGTFSTLWQKRQNAHGQLSWYHIVTQREVFEEPQEAKGAILADDMGLGKTISCVALIAATMNSAQQFASSPLQLPPPPQEAVPDEPPLTADHFAGTVWGTPQLAPQPTSAKAKAKQARENDKAYAEYTRACRLKAKSRATLIICPLSTVVNWEDQFREHWQGQVTVVGGGGGTSCGQTFTPTAASIPSTPQPLIANSSWASSTSLPHSSQILKAVDEKLESAARGNEGTPLRVYVYHGNARRPDPAFLADFDAVITTYATLATEYSKQCRSATTADDDDDDGGSSDGFAEVDERGNAIVKLRPKKNGVKKRKKSAAGSSGVECTSALQSVYWFRVVLDEAHSIKEISTVACRACCDLVADRRLCLTGTPVQNKLDDVYALIKFLRLSPFDDKSVWTEFIGTPVKYGQPLGVARLQTIMKCITLRRTKESKAENGQRILSLPPRRDELRYLKFDEQEQAIYDQFFTESKAEFNELSNKNEVMKNYVGILQKILRLRQICDHFELVMNKGLGLVGDTPSPGSMSYEELASAVANEGINPTRAAAIFAILREAGTAQCVECGYEHGISGDNNGDGCPLADTPSSQTKRGRKVKASASSSRTSTRPNSPVPASPILTRCQHLFCVACFRSSCFPGWPHVPCDTRRCCSVCQTALSPTDAVEITPELLAENNGKKKPGKREKRQKLTSYENLQLSTKIKALLGDLIYFSRANPHSANYDPESQEVQMVDEEGNQLDDGVVKTVVFSQWTSMLDKIEDALDAVGIRYDRLDGTMKRDDRTRAMDALKYDPGCEVLLVSLKAGGVGLNLTAAQRVYLMDPYWNPAVENQAVDRIHRLGQKRPVTTIKLIIENSIEARLLEVQKKKTELANMTLGQNLTKAEMHQRRLEELNKLFSG